MYVFTVNDGVHISTRGIKGRQQNKGNKTDEKNILSETKQKKIFIILEVTYS